MKKIFIVFLLLSLNAFAIEIKSKYAVLMDYNTGDVLYNKNASAKVSPSSMTKIMTSYIIFESLDSGVISLNDKLKVSILAWKQEGSRMFLNPNSSVSIDDLLKGLIVQSGNDAAMTLAEGVEYNLETFVLKMNNTAKILNLKNTNFTNPIGFHDENHYMSVFDTALLSKNLIKKFESYYKKYFAINSYIYNKIWQPNRNKLLKIYEGCDGIKTGHTNEGGFSMSVSAVKNDRRLIAVINGADSEKMRENDSKELLDYGFSLSKVRIFNKGDIIETKQILYGEPKEINIVTETDIFAWLTKDEKIKQDVIIYRDMVAPLEKNEIVGEIIINSKSYNLVVADNVEKIGWFRRMFSK
jgi:D-alanyl-D-alanine carboxypeptidase (penicillin-binding protein 5/6)